MNILDYKNQEPYKFYIIRNDKGEYLNCSIHLDNGVNSYHYSYDTTLVATFDDLNSVDEFCKNHKDVLLDNGNCNDWFIELVTVKVTGGIVL